MHECMSNQEVTKNIHEIEEQNVSTKEYKLELLTNLTHKIQRITNNI